MAEDSRIEITALLTAWRGGDSAALDRLTPLVYEELRGMAGRYMRREGPGNSLQPTALVNELFQRLIDARNVPWRDRVHFFAMSARLMRRVLVDAARTREAEKRGGGAIHFELDESLDGAPLRDDQIVRLNDALEALASFNARKAQVIELFFGGLSVEETAEVLNISPQSVMRDWRLARTWLARELLKGG